MPAAPRRSASSPLRKLTDASRALPALLRDLAAVYDAIGVVARHVSWRYDPQTYERLGGLEPVTWVWVTPHGRLPMTAREQELLAAWAADPAIQSYLETVAEEDELRTIGLRFRSWAPVLEGYYAAQHEVAVEKDLPASIADVLAASAAEDDDEVAPPNVFAQEPYRALVGSGFTAIRVVYGGGGDSGQIEECGIEGVDDPSDDQQAAAERLADVVTEHLGYDWYNNEGGGGTFVILPDGQITFESAYYYQDAEEPSELRLRDGAPLSWAPPESRALRQKALTRLLGDKKLPRERRLQLLTGLEQLFAAAAADRPPVAGAPRRRRAAPPAAPTPTAPDLVTPPTPP